MNRFWRDRIPQWKLDESMDDLGREIAQLGHGDFAQRPHDLDEGRPPPQIPETLDLFADGIAIAQEVLDWEKRAGQEIAPLIAHIRKSQELRASVEMQAKRSVPEQGSAT